MKVREVIRLLEKHGWVEMRSKGSHRHFKHPNELAVGTLNVILKAARLK
jgi:predicted RNA binding protein YcfA (HicA-like mRNA interferase family)